MKTTRYIGKVVDNRVYLICKDDKGQTIQVPHIDIMRNKGYSAVAYHEGTPIAPFKFLNTFELAMFFKGNDINDKRLKTPAEQEKEHQDYLKAHPEILKQCQKLREILKIGE